jgi:hypothetical protein
MKRMCLAMTIVVLDENVHMQRSMPGRLPTALRFRGQEAGARIGRLQANSSSLLLQVGDRS